MSASTEGHMTAHRACQEAERIVRDIVHQEEATGNLSWDESPLKPWIIDSARSLLIMQWEKSSFLYGSGKGQGIIVTRCPTAHKSLIKVGEL